jgi:multidrug efflux system membrane fusion protein
MGLTITAAVLTMALLVASNPRADEDEEKPIISGAAQVSHDAAGNTYISLRPATQKEIGLTTEALKLVARPIEVEAYGFVLDPAPLSRLDSDLISAQAALDASAAQYRRSRQLYAEQKNVSLRDLQTAQAAYLTDRTRLEALQQQLRDTWGIEVTQMDTAARAELVRALIDRRQALVRVTVPAGVALDGLPTRAEVIALGHEDHPLAARAVYYAPTVDARMQGQTFLVLVGTAEFPVRPGMAISAILPAAGKVEQGVMVPRSAVVRYAGQQWVYQVKGNRFVRREIVPAQTTSDGYLVTQGVEAAMRVVISGAQTLLSEELKAQIRPAD